MLNNCVSESLGMELDIYQVDAFTNKVFSGNPAAVCPLMEWLPDDVMQSIALENNLSETAFVVPVDEKTGRYHIRWFTPVAEVDLCGHATLATAYTLFECLSVNVDCITFDSKSGSLQVSKANDGFLMDFPLWNYKRIDPPQQIIDSLGCVPLEYYEGYDDIAVFDNAECVSALKPNMGILASYEGARGVLATAPASPDEDLDFVSRAFFPRLSVDEDPVTGSAHCLLAPYWAKKLGKTKLKARQVSKRSGDLLCEIKGDRLNITGQAILYMHGKIFI